MKKNKKTILLGITGSIAAYKACDIISLLKKEGFDVKVLLTKEAKEFVTALTIQTLSQNKIIADMFELPDEWSPAHMSLAQEADLVMVAPATANIIAKIASGVCDDMLTCTIFATEAPVMIAPAMNENMYRHPITQANIEKLKKIGYVFIGPIKGHLACGCEGIGHIADINDIVKEAKRLLK